MRTLFRRGEWPRDAMLTERERALMDRWREPNWLWCPAQVSKWLGIPKRRATALLRALERKGLISEHARKAMGGVQ